MTSRGPTHDPGSRQVSGARPRATRSASSSSATPTWSSRPPTEYLTDYLGPKFNVAFVISEDIDDADAELTVLGELRGQRLQGHPGLPGDSRPKATLDQVPRAGHVLHKGREAVDEQEFKIGDRQPLLRRWCLLPWATVSWATTASRRFLKAAPRKIGMATGGRQVGQLPAHRAHAGCRGGHSRLRDGEPGDQDRTQRVRWVSGRRFQRRAGSDDRGEPRRHLRHLRR